MKIQLPLLALFFALPVASSADITYHHDIAPLIGQKCLGCHSEDLAGAPFSLAKYDDVFQRAEAIRDDITNRIMPPFGVDNSGSCGSFSNTSWLSDSEIALVTDWVTAGAPEGDPTTATSIPAPELNDHLAHVDGITQMKKPYTALAGGDDMRCFLVDSPTKVDAFVTGFNVIPGDKKHVHHVLVWVPDFLGVLMAVWNDLKSPGQGYPCFGSAEATGTPLAAWGPGTGAVVFPDGIGVPIPAHYPLILQVHYSSELAGGAPPVPDQTKIELQLEKSVKQPVEIDFFGRIAGVTIPPQQQSWAFERTWKVQGGAKPSPGAAPPFDIYGFLPHMHLYGHDEQFEIKRGGTGQTECAVNDVQWDFGHQRMYLNRGPVSVNDGDEVTIRCNYNTMSTTNPVIFGETTADEMCIMGVMLAWKNPKH
jgi:hypothetical protein